MKLKTIPTFPELFVGGRSLFYGQEAIEESGPDFDAGYDIA